MGTNFNETTKFPHQYQVQKYNFFPKYKYICEKI